MDWILFEKYGMDCVSKATTTGRVNMDLCGGRHMSSTEQGL